MLTDNNYKPILSLHRPSRKLPESVAVNKIMTYLREVEAKYDITILFAAEYGSRSWGSATAGSDFDVRFIYRRNGGVRNYVLRIPKRDNVLRETECINQIDLQGWDIDKTADLTVRSNFQIWEIVNSSVVYIEYGNFREIMHRYSNFFCPRAGWFSATEIARRELRACEDLESRTTKVNTKKLFYVIRHILLARWVIQNNEFPNDVTIENLLTQVDNDNLKEAIINFVAIRRSGKKDISTHKVTVVKSWCEVMVAHNNKMKEYAPLENYTPYEEALNLMMDLINLEIKNG